MLSTDIFKSFQIKYDQAGKTALFANGAGVCPFRGDI